MSFPINNGDFHVRYVSLPEGICDGTMIYTTLDADEGDHRSMFNLHNVNDYLKYNVS